MIRLDIQFRYAVADSKTLTCKIWRLANNWEALLIRDPDHQNKKQVINAMMLMIQILLITVFIGPFWSIMSGTPQDKGRNLLSLVDSYIAIQKFMQDIPYNTVQKHQLHLGQLKILQC